MVNNEFEEKMMREITTAVVEGLACAKQFPQIINSGVDMSWDNRGKWQIAGQFKESVMEVWRHNAHQYIETINMLKKDSERDREILYNASEAILRLDARYREIIADQKQELDDLKLRLCVLEGK
jgi:hypothetical protein